MRNDTDAQPASGPPEAAGDKQKQKVGLSPRPVTGRIQAPSMVIIPGGSEPLLLLPFSLSHFFASLVLLVHSILVDEVVFFSCFMSRSHDLSLR